jgi:hypothetical protein
LFLEITPPVFWKYPGFISWKCPQYFQESELTRGIAGIHFGSRTMAIFIMLILGSAILSLLALAAPFGETEYAAVYFATVYIDGVDTAAPTEPAPTTTILTTTIETSINPPLSSSTPLVTVTQAAVTPTPPSTTSAAPAPTTSAADAGIGSDAPSFASDSATCEGKGLACQGDITYYDGGLGACGMNVDPTGNGIALPFAFMGTQSNGNPYCYRSLTIYNPATGVSAQAEVMDKCEGCDGRSIDLTPALFSTLTNNDLGLGRVHGVDWWFN